MKNMKPFVKFVTSALVLTLAIPVTAELTPDQVKECAGRAALAYLITKDRDAGISEHEELEKLKNVDEYHGISITGWTLDGGGGLRWYVLGDASVIYGDVNGVVGDPSALNAPLRNTPEENKTSSMLGCQQHYNYLNGITKDREDLEKATEKFNLSHGRDKQGYEIGSKYDKELNSGPRPPCIPRTIIQPGTGLKYSVSCP